MYQNKFWVFGGGNGLQVLDDDVWTLDVSSSLDRMKWEQVAISGRKTAFPARIPYCQSRAERDDRHWR